MTVPICRPAMNKRVLPETFLLGPNRVSVNIFLLRFCYLFALSYSGILQSSKKNVVRKNVVNDPPPRCPFWMVIVCYLVYYIFLNVTSTSRGKLKSPMCKPSVQTLFSPNRPHHIYVYCNHYRNSQVSYRCARPYTTAYNTINDADSIR